MMDAGLIVMSAFMVRICLKCASNALVFNRKSGIVARWLIVYAF